MRVGRKMRNKNRKRQMRRNVVRMKKTECYRVREMKGESGGRTVKIDWEVRMRRKRRESVLKEKEDRVKNRRRQEKPRRERRWRRRERSKGDEEGEKETMKRKDGEQLSEDVAAHSNRRRDHPIDQKKSQWSLNPWINPWIDHSDKDGAFRWSTFNDHSQVDDPQESVKTCLSSFLLCMFIFLSSSATNSMESFKFTVKNLFFCISYWLCITDFTEKPKNP